MWSYGKTLPRNSVVPPAMQAQATAAQQQLFPQGLPGTTGPVDPRIGPRPGMTPPPQAGAAIRPGSYRRGTLASRRPPWMGPAGRVGFQAGAMQPPPPQTTGGEDDWLGGGANDFQGQAMQGLWKQVLNMVNSGAMGNPLQAMQQLQYRRPGGIGSMF